MGPVSPQSRRDQVVEKQRHMRPPVRDSRAGVIDDGMTSLPTQPLHPTPPSKLNSPPKKRAAPAERTSPRKRQPRDKENNSSSVTSENATSALTTMLIAKQASRSNSLPEADREP